MSRRIRVPSVNGLVDVSTPTAQHEANLMRHEFDLTRPPKTEEVKTEEVKTEEVKTEELFSEDSNKKEVE